MSDNSEAFSAGFIIGGTITLTIFSIGLVIFSGASELEMRNHAKKLGAGDWVVNPTTHKAEWKWKDEMTIQPAEAKP